MKGPLPPLLGLFTGLTITMTRVSAGIWTGGHGDIGVDSADNELVLRYEIGSTGIVDETALLMIKLR